MTGTSPRTGLATLADIDVVNTSPSAINANSSAMDTMSSITPATSGSRPLTPFDGQWIFETDTQSIRRWNAAESAWQLLGQAAKRGLVNTFTNTAAATTPGTAGGSTLSAISLLDFNMTVVAGHMYKIIEQGWYGISGSPQQSGVNPLFVTLGPAIDVSNPALNLASLDGLYSDYLQTVFMPAKKSYYRVTFYLATATTMFYRSVFMLDASSLPATINVGKASDASFPAKAWVYDLGVYGAN